MRISFHHQPEAQHPNFPLSTSRQADYPIFRGFSITSRRGLKKPRISWHLSRFRLRGRGRRKLPVSARQKALVSG